MSLSIAMITRGIASAQDVVLLRGLVAAAFVENFPGAPYPPLYVTLEDSLWNKKPRLPRIYWVGFDADHHPVGYSMLSPTRGHIAYFNVYVKPQFRRLGYGTRLFRELEGYARDKWITELGNAVNCRDEPYGHPFLEELGAQRSVTFPSYEVDLYSLPLDLEVGSSRLSVHSRLHNPTMNEVGELFSSRGAYPQRHWGGWLAENLGHTRRAKDVTSDVYACAIERVRGRVVGCAALLLFIPGAVIVRDIAVKDGDPNAYRDFILLLLGHYAGGRKGRRKLLVPTATPLPEDLREELGFYPHFTIHWNLLLG